MDTKKLMVRVAVYDPPPEAPGMPHIGLAILPDGTKHIETFGSHADAVRFTEEQAKNFLARFLYVTE